MARLRKGIYFALVRPQSRMLCVAHCLSYARGSEECEGIENDSIRCAFRSSCGRSREIEFQYLLMTSTFIFVEWGTDMPTDTNSGVCGRRGALLPVELVI